MEQPGPRHLVALVRSIAVLALPADAQVAWASQLCQDGGPPIDELALEFDDGFQLAPAFIERGWLDASVLPALTQLDEHLNSMSGEHNADLWAADALASRSEWDRIRAFARTALTLLG